MRLFVPQSRMRYLHTYACHASRDAIWPALSRLPSEVRGRLSRTVSTDQAPPQWTRHALRTFNNVSPADGITMSSKGPAQLPIAYIGLGSNMGDRIALIEQACNMMAARGIKVRKTSCLWETEPMYLENQSNFINGVCEIETSLDPLALLDELLDIEIALGRKRIVDNGPRTIDLDILLYDDRVIDHERLIVPHPGIFERHFVLGPLSELIPGRALDPRKPWRVIEDYLNALPEPSASLSTVSPLSDRNEPFRALDQFRKSKVMGILNMTPDSLCASALPMVLSAEQHAMSKEDQVLKFITSRDLHKASIIDIGGQSTAPASVPVSADTEMARICPAIISIKKAFPNLPISVDTYYASVAREAVRHGADIINDVSAGTLDPDMLSTMAELGKTVILMHMRGDPQSMTSQEHTSYPDGLIPTIASELRARVQAAEEAGVKRWRIVLDPGIGFAKNAPQNIEVLRRFSQLRDWPHLKGLPWLVGSSNKRFVGRYSGLGKDSAPEDRIWGTAATCAAAVQAGADIVRVHDVKEMSQVVKMSNAIWRA